jgi:hypothetical protein
MSSVQLSPCAVIQFLLITLHSYDKKTDDVPLKTSANQAASDPGEFNMKIYLQSLINKIALGVS